MTYGLRIHSARKRRARKRCRKSALECCKVDDAYREGRPHYRVFSGYQLPFWVSRGFFDDELGRRTGGAVAQVQNAVWARLAQEVGES